MGKVRDLTGQQFGRLTAISYLPAHGKNSAVMWICSCECGNTAIVRGTDLTTGHTMSCGCLPRLTKAVRVSELRLHNIWSNMKQRCTNPNKPDYKYYGGRGITVCKEWSEDFWNFYHWAMNNGYRDGLTIERTNNDGGYTPENCRWIPASEQKRNTRANRFFVIHGRRFTLADICRIYGQNPSTVSNRIKKGMSIEEALRKTGGTKWTTNCLNYLTN